MGAAPSISAENAGARKNQYTPNTSAEQQAKRGWEHPPIDHRRRADTYGQRRPPWIRLTSPSRSHGGMRRSRTRPQHRDSALISQGPMKRRTTSKLGQCRQHGRSGHAALRTLVPRCEQQREAQAPPQQKRSKPTNNSQRRRGSAYRTRRASDRGSTGRRTAGRTTKHRRPYSPPKSFLARNLNNCKSRASDCERSHSKQMSHRLALKANIEFPLRNLTP